MSHTFGLWQQLRPAELGLDHLIRHADIANEPLLNQEFKNFIQWYFCDRCCIYDWFFVADSGPVFSNQLETVAVLNLRPPVLNDLILLSERGLFRHLSLLDTRGTWLSWLFLWDLQVRQFDCLWL